MSDALTQTTPEPNFKKVYTYRTDDPDPVLATNPMALVFPAPFTDEQLYEQFEKPPRVHAANFRSLPVEVRIGYLEFIDDFHYVFQVELAIGHKVLAVVRKSFHHRHPNNPRILNDIFRMMAGQTVTTPRVGEAGAGGGLGMVIVGITGIGKSSLIDRITAMLGAYGRFHQTFNGQPAQWPQLGVIRVNVGPTWKITLILILREVDRQLGRDVYVNRERGSSEDRLQLAVQEALTSGFAPLLIVDELQRLTRQMESKARRILEGFIDLMTMWGIPVVLVGTVRIRHLLENFAAEMDKFSNGGIIEMARMTELDDDTLNFISLLKECNVSLTPIVYSDDFDFLLLHQCMGVRRIMREYMKVVLTRHANDERITVDGALLTDISLNEMQRFEASLSVLRRTQLGMRLSYAELQSYEDYLPMETSSKTQTADEVSLEAEWRSQHQVAPRQAAPLLSATEFANLQHRIEARDLHTPAEQAQMVYENLIRTASKPPHPSVPATAAPSTPTGTPPQSATPAPTQPKAAKRPRSKSTQKAAKQLKNASKRKPLGAGPKPKPGDEGGIDPSDVR
jgi:hypothetical protein